MSWNGFADLGCEAVGRALASNSCLDTLDLSSNRIGYEGCHNLAKALVLNNTLTCLKVSSILYLEFKNRMADIINLHLLLYSRQLCLFLFSNILYGQRNQLFFYLNEFD